MIRQLYLGMPGSGKTTTLINLLETELMTTPATRIAYVSFTKKAIGEAQERAFKRFNLSKKDMPFFRTLHALAFAVLGLKKEDVVSDAHLKQLGEQIGVDLINKSCPFQPLALYNFARARKESLYAVWGRTYLIHTKTWDEIHNVVARYMRFKADNTLIDFTDMLIMFNALKTPLPVDVAFVDEAQDLSTIQWQMLDIAFSGVKKLVLAGDDDQCIYGWSGANQQKFMSFEGEKIILDKSYRCPQAVANFANAISSKVTYRYKKTLYGKEGGAVVRLASLEQIVDKMTYEEFLILVRNRAHIGDIKNNLFLWGIPFTIHGHNVAPFKHQQAIEGYISLTEGKKVVGSVAEAVAECAGITGVYFDSTKEYTYADIFKLDLSDAIPEWHMAFSTLTLKRRAYYRLAVQHGGVFKEPRVHVSTIHGAKGSECDNVVLGCDQSILTYKSGQRHPENEHRVFYVGATRARKTLYLLPQTRKRHYVMPNTEAFK